MSRTIFICLLPEKTQKEIEKACKKFYKKNGYPWNPDCMNGRVVDLEDAIDLEKLGL